MLLNIRMCMYFAGMKGALPPSQYFSAISLVSEKFVPNRQKYSRATKNENGRETCNDIIWPHPSSICASFNELFTLHWFLALHGPPKAQSPPFLFVFLGNIQPATAHSLPQWFANKFCSQNDRFGFVFCTPRWVRSLDSLDAPLRQVTINRHAVTPLFTENPKCLPLSKPMPRKAQWESKLHTEGVPYTHTLKIGKCNLLTNCATHVGLFQLLPQQSVLVFGCAYLKGEILVIKFYLNVINARVQGLEGKKKRHVTGEADSTRLCRDQSWKLGRFCTAPIRSERDTFKPSRIGVLWGWNDTSHVGWEQHSSGLRIHNAEWHNFNSSQTKLTVSSSAHITLAHCERLTDI